MLRIKSAIIFTAIFLAAGVSAQPANNFDLLKDLVRRSVNEISEKLPGGAEVNAVYNSPDDYTFFNPVFTSSLRGSGYEIADSAGSPVLEYYLNEAKIEYPDIFRTWFLGGYKAERRGYISGSYIIRENSRVVYSEEFEFSETDTIDYDMIGELENRAMPFTGGEKPEGSFIFSLWEPFIAVTATIITIYLFFSVRSK